MLRQFQYNTLRKQMLLNWICLSSNLSNIRGGGSEDARGCV